ncbi:MAG: flagellar protein FliS [Kistimonas sp.]|nr:flagellar protein FliS [Kistimonas sp.]
MKPVRCVRGHYRDQQYAGGGRQTAAGDLEVLMMGLDDILCQLEGSVTVSGARRGELAGRCLDIFAALQGSLRVPARDARDGPADGRARELGEQLGFLYDQCSFFLLRAMVENSAEPVQAVRRIVGTLREGWRDLAAATPDVPLSSSSDGQGVVPVEVQTGQGEESSGAVAAITTGAGTEWTA